MIIDVFGRPDAFERNVEIEYERNRERYQFLRWGQGAFDEFKVVPPGTGIVHQVNIEHLARTVMTRNGQAYPDTCVGTDSHTTMVNGLGVLGWGVGGIEAEAAMLGQPVSMLIPRVVGFKLTGEIPAGATATDVVLTITEMLRKHGVVGKFVEFYGEGVAAVPLANRATIGNMSPEFGSTAAIFPIDEETVRYLKLTGRSAEQVALVEAYAKEQGLWHDPAREPAYSEYLELDLSTVVPSIAGPKRPQDRIELSDAKSSFRKSIHDYVDGERRHARTPRWTRPRRSPSRPATRRRSRSPRTTPRRSRPPPPNGASGRPSKPVEGHDAGRRRVRARPRRRGDRLDHLLHQHLEPVGHARRRAARQATPSTRASRSSRGSRRRWRRARRSSPTTTRRPACGRTWRSWATTWSATAAPRASATPARCRTRSPRRSRTNDLAVVSVLSGNRNFEGRINPDVKMNYLASRRWSSPTRWPARWTSTSTTSRWATDTDGNDVFLKDIWPTPQEIQETIDSAITQEMFTKDYADVFDGDERWQSLPTPEGNTFEWDAESTYVRKPPYFEGMPPEPAPVTDITGARVLAKLGDSVTTDHISPAGAIKPDTPAAQYLTEHGVERKDFNSYGSRRGNHEVMIRGTFANIRLRNQLLDDVQGGYTRDFTQDGAPQAFIYDAAQNYAAAGTPLVVLGGKEYGSGSSRDWAAKGTALLGVRAVIAESFERIHRSNLIGMGVLPLQFPAGESAASLRPGRHRDVRHLGHHRAERRRDPAHGARHRHQGGRRPRWSSTRSSASTPRARRTTTATAASCSTCCGR